MGASVAEGVIPPGSAVGPTTMCNCSCRRLLRSWFKARLRNVEFCLLKRTLNNGEMSAQFRRV